MTKTEASAQQLDLRVNGEPRRVPAGTTVDGLLREIGIASGKVAVERNAAIVPRSQYGLVLLESGDALEIVRFVGGG